MKKGFTLIELLVVVLIIGILAAIALPQYEKAVTKSRIATMLPLMRRWYDALAVYKMEHGHYGNDSEWPTSDNLGVSWPSDWNTGVSDLEGWNDLWYCFSNEEAYGEGYCQTEWLGEDMVRIWMFQPDTPDGYSAFAGKRVCEASTQKGKAICNSLGGKKLEGTIWEGECYEF